MDSIESVIRHTEPLLQELVNDKIKHIKSKFSVLKCHQARKLLSLIYFVELVRILNDNNILLNQEKTIGVKFINYHQDTASAFNFSLNAENNLTLSLKNDVLIPTLDMLKLPLDLYIASSTQLNLSQHSSKELYINCPITAPPVHHWPHLILMNLTEAPLSCLLYTSPSPRDLP